MRVVTETFWPSVWLHHAKHADRLCCFGRNGVNKVLWNKLKTCHITDMWRVRTVLWWENLHSNCLYKQTQWRNNALQQLTPAKLERKDMDKESSNARWRCLAVFNSAFIELSGFDKLEQFGNVLVGLVLPHQGWIVSSRSRSHRI